MIAIKTIDSKFYRELGNRIRDVRRERNMSLYELSKLTGFSKSMLDMWELGLSKIKPKQYSLICEALQISESIKIEVKLGY